MISYNELYTPIFISGFQKERTKDKMLTDNMGLDVWGCMFNSKRIKQSRMFYHRFVGACNCTKKWQRQQTWRIRNCRYQRSQTQTNKIPVKHLERPRWNSKNITLTMKDFVLENNRTSLLLTTYKCRSAIYKKYYMSELALHKSQPSHFSQF